MPAITSENVALAIVKLIASRAVKPLLGKLVIGSLINRDYEPMLANGGDTVNVPIPPTLVANNLAEGGTVQTQNPNLGNAQIVLDTHAESTFLIPDVTRALASIDLIDTYMTPAINAIAASVESAVLANYPNFIANTPLGSASSMDEARIDAAETALFDALAPQDQPEFMIVSSGAFSQLRQVPRFTEYQTVGPSVGASPMVTGKLPGDGPYGADGKIKDFLVFRSQYVPKVGGTTYNLAFSRDALSMAIRRLPLPMPGTGAVAQYAELGNFGMRVTMSYQPNTLAQQFTVDMLYGVGVLRNQFGVIVKSNT